MGATLQKENKHNVASDYQEGGNNVSSNKSQQVSDGATGSAFSHVKMSAMAAYLARLAIPEQD